MNLQRTCHPAVKLATNSVEIVKSGNSRGRGRNTNRARMRRVNLIGRDDGQSETGSESDEDKMMLHVNESGNQPFVRKGKIHKESFTAMIESGSPSTIFTAADFRKILEVDVSFARP